MEDCILTGEYILVDIAAYNEQSIQYNDIVLLKAPFEPYPKIVKRCVGLPGDTIKFFDGTIVNNCVSIVNPVSIPNDTAMQTTDGGDSVIIPKIGTVLKIDKSNYKFYELCLQKYENVNGPLQSSFYHEFKNDYFFLVGDNRNSSSDSRDWGVVPLSNVIGKVSHIVFSVDENYKIREDRLFKNID